MAKDYEGKIGIGQLLFCLIALATLLIPYTLDPMIFSFDKIMPIGNSVINEAQNNYIAEFFSTLSFPVPEAIYQVTVYVVYAFYGIVALTLFLTLVMMLLRNEPLRQILRALSIIAGLLMLAIMLVHLVTVAGFFTYYLNGKFGEGALIFDCITNQGLLFFLGITVFSALGMVKHFSSFFGKSY